MHKTKIIETKRLILRPFKEEDYKECYLNYTSDPMVSLYLTWDAHQNEEVTQNYLKSKIPLYEKEDFFDWCVTKKEKNGDTTIIGAIASVNFIRKDRYVEIGYCYGSKFWHNGYATEALNAVIDFFFREEDIDVVCCRYMAVNERSGNVMKKCHMTKVAVLKGFAYNNVENMREDVIVKTITKEKYFKLKKNRVKK